MLLDAVGDGKFADELLKMINASIKASTVPECFKTSVVVLILKIGKASAPEEFRPINNLQVIERKIESVIKNTTFKLTRGE